MKRGALSPRTAECSLHGPGRLGWPARFGTVLTAVLVVMLTAVTPAGAYWRANGSGAGEGATATLSAPATVTVPVVGTSSVPVGWAASTGPPQPTGYYVTRYGGLLVSAACGSSATTLLTGTSCIDPAVPDGSYTYRVTAVYLTWTATSPPSGTITVATPTKLTVSRQPTTTVAGLTITPSVAVTVQTAAGTPVPIAGIPVTVGIGVNPGGGALGGTLTQNTDVTGVATFPDLTIDKSGAGYTVTSTSPGLGSATSTVFTVTAAAASRLAISAGPISGPAAGTASIGPITVSVQDAFGNAATAAGGGVSVSLSSNTAGTGAFATTVNGSTATSVLIPAATNSAVFYYGDTRAGTPTLTAAATGLTPAARTATITPATANRLVISSAAVTGPAAATATLGPIAVAVQDAYGNQVTAPTGGIAVTLSSNSTGTAVFSATPAGPTVTSIVIPAGSGSAAFYYGDTKAGTPTLTAAAAGLTPATQTATITAAAANRLIFTSAAVTGPAGAAASLGPITVAIRDAFGNQVTAPTGGIAVTLSSNSTGTAVFSATPAGPTVTSIVIPAGSGSAAFYYGDTRAGTPTLTAAATGLTSATQTATILPAATQLVITSAAVTGPAAGTATLGPITVALRDASGSSATAPAGGVSVSLSSSTAGTAVFSATLGGSTTGTVLIAAGSSSAVFYYGDTKAGTPTLTTTATGLTSATQTVTVTAAGAAKLVITSTAITGIAAATATLGPSTVAVQDTFGNPVRAPAGGTTVTLSSTSAGVAVFSATAGGPTASTISIAAGASSAAYYYGDTRAGTPTLTATVTGVGSVTQTATITAAAASQLGFGQQPTTVKKNRPISPAVTVLIQDQFGNQTSSSASVTIAILNNPTATPLTGTPTQAALSGVATFGDLSIDGGRAPATGYTLQATSTGLTAVTSNPFAVTS